MSKDDTEFLLASWKELCENLMSVNDSLRDLTKAQQETILKLQGVQTVPKRKVLHKP